MEKLLEVLDDGINPDWDGTFNGFDFCSPDGPISPDECAQIIEECLYGRAPGTEPR